MRNLRKLKNTLNIFLYVLFLFFAKSAYAICPICTVAVAGGIGLSRHFGIDDTITALWIGGLAVSLIIWTIDWMERKNFRFKFYKPVTALFYYFIIIAPLYWTEYIGHPFNKFLGMDKIILGTVVGSSLFFSGAMFHFYSKKKNDNKVYFPFQKVVFSISPLIVFSVFFYFITK